MTLCDIDLERACAQFLYREAELLDDGLFDEWVATCLAADLAYLVPTRTTRERAPGVSEFSDHSFHMKETLATMQMRVKRLGTDHAWAENPASRTRRVVTNIRVRELPADEAEVKSCLTLYRSQWDTTAYDLLVADRRDVLRVEAGEWRLAKRIVLLSHTILPTANLGIFL